MAEIKGYSGGDLFTRFAHGVLQGYLEKRNAGIKHKEQMDLIAAQQAGMTEREQLQQAGMMDRTQYTQGQMNDRTAATIAGASERAGSKPVRDPVADAIAIYEGKVGVDKKHGIGKFAPPKEKSTKPEKQPNLDPKIKDKITRWGNAEENARLGEYTTDMLGNQTPRAHHANYAPIPTMEGKPAPRALWQKIAETAVKFGVDDQAAANRVYAEAVTDQIATNYSVDPTEMFFDVERIKALPSLQGRNIFIPNIGGKTNAAGLAALAATGGWTVAELGELLDEYFGKTTTQRQPASNPLEVNGAAQ